MRRLLLLSHGKSARPPGLDDLDRPLARRGREAARRMGHYLADEDLRPDLALVSPARRTDETWTLARESLGSVPWRTEPRIYEAAPDFLLAVVNRVEPEAGTLLLVGHNPGLEELLHILIPLQERYGRAGSIPKFPTAGLAVVNVPAADWRELSPRSAHLERFVTPKSLGLGGDE